MQQEAIEVGTCLSLIGVYPCGRVLIHQQPKKPWRSTQLRRFVSLHVMLHNIARMVVTDTLTGDRPPHQAHGPSQLARYSTAFTNAVQFDERKGATWHCIVGRNFGSFVTHGKRYL